MNDPKQTLQSSPRQTITKLRITLRDLTNINHNKPPSTVDPRIATKTNNTKNDCKNINFYIRSYNILNQ